MENRKLDEQAVRLRLKQAFQQAGNLVPQTVIERMINQITNEVMDPPLERKAAEVIAKLKRELGTR